MGKLVFTIANRQGFEGYHGTMGTECGVLLIRRFARK